MWRSCSNTDSRWRLAYWPHWRRSTGWLPSHRNWWCRSDWLIASRRWWMIISIPLNCHLPLYVFLKDGITSGLIFCLPSFSVLLLTPTTEKTVLHLACYCVLSSEPCSTVQKHKYQIALKFNLRIYDQNQNTNPELCCLPVLNWQTCLHLHLHICLVSAYIYRTPDITMS